MSLCNYKHVLGMGTIAIYYLTYSSHIQHADTIPYEPLEELSKVWHAVQVMPYNDYMEVAGMAVCTVYTKNVRFWLLFFYLWH
jgi:hypothetical protein